MHIIIFANGDLSQSPLPLPDHDLLVAADGGARHAYRYGLVPDILIGDFDSLKETEINRVSQAGAELIHHPTEKDETDLELALDFAVTKGAAEITLYGLFGGRWDMTFANLLLLAAEKYSKIRFKAVHDQTDFHILRGGETLALRGTPGQTVSILPLNGPAEGLTYSGLTWPLDNASLPFGTPRGVSNSLAASEASITLSRGTILLIHDKSTSNEA